MEKNNIISEKELNKILNLIESKHAALISEQTDPTQLANSIYQEIWKARNNSDQLARVISKIPSLQIYNGVNGILAKNVPADSNSIVKILNKELGFRDVKNANQIKNALAKIGKNISFGISGDNSVESDSVKIVSTVPANSPLNLDPMAREKAWQTTLSCVTKQPGAKAYKLKDGTTAYNVGGIFYYNGGRKKLADGTMADYSCKTEFKTSGSSTIVKKKSNLGPRFAKSAQSLGVQNPKMDVATLQKILASLEGDTPKTKTAADYLPKEIEAPSQEELNAQLPPKDNQYISV